jgi:hypothetical protein
MPKMPGMAHGGGGTNPAARTWTRQLHVVLHGLYCIRLSQSKRKASLHIPDIGKAHIYFAGSLDNLRKMPRRSKLRLSAPKGSLQIDPTSFKVNFLAVCLGEIKQVEQADFKVGKVHTSIDLPWPNAIHQVRTIQPGAGAHPLFWYNNRQVAVDPQQMGYVNYLTYDLGPRSKPVLKMGADQFWSSEALGQHTCLHFFADPPLPLTNKEWAMHIDMGYDALNNQIFDPKFDLEQNLNPRPKWNLADANNPDLNPWEQVDLRAPFGKMNMLGDVGNCLGVYVLD